MSPEEYNKKEIFFLTISFFRYIFPMNSTEERETPWQVDLTHKAEKQAGGLPRPSMKFLPC
jgi:hypothetical protein